MTILDFKELSNSRANAPDGENLEGLVRELGKELGLRPDWTGRGADRGRDLLFTERRRGALGSYEVRWLVSCKDFAKSGRSVAENDVGSVADKVKQHGAQGFLLATTTTVSTGLKAMLDGIHNPMSLETRVWDRHELEHLLLQDEHSSLVKRFLPESYAAWRRLGNLPQTLQALETLLPDSINVKIRNILDTYRAEDSWLTGELIWPFDSENATIIDSIVEALLERKSVVDAAEIINDQEIEFDAVVALLDTLVRLQPELAKDLCSKLIETNKQDGCALFAFRFYVNHFEPSNEQQITLAMQLQPDDLHELYADEVAMFVDQDLSIDPTGHQLWDDLDSLSSHTQLEEAYADDLSFTADLERRRINFQGSLTVSVNLSYDHEDHGSSSYPGTVKGYLNHEGMFIEEATVDTQSFYR